MIKNRRKAVCVLTMALLLIFSMTGCGTEKLDNTVKNEEKADSWMDSTNASAQEKKSSQDEKSDDSKKSDKKEESRESKDKAEKEEYFDLESAGDDKVDYSKYEDKKGSGPNTGTGSSDENGSDGQSGDITYSDGTSTEEGEYDTDPIPEGMQNPVEPGDIDIDTTKSNTCYLSISCGTILDNMENLTEGKETLVPSDGIIYEQREVTFYEGESVSDVLLRETQNNRIHLEYSFTPGYNSNYIEGINNLYEFDCGKGSGWMYCVNGWYPNYGCSRYIVQAGDVIEWNYTCDLGRDLGVDWMSQKP